MTKNSGPMISLPDTRYYNSLDFALTRMYAPGGMAESFDIDKARETLRKRDQARRKELALRLKKARTEREGIIAMLIEKYRPERIYTWGSVDSGDTFSEISDIDIALEGLSGPMEGLHALGDAEELTCFPVDLVELERIHPAHADTIRSRGRLVYERT